MSEVVLDASAVLAYLNDEPGSDEVHGVLAHAAISAVNQAEVVTKLAETGHSRDEVSEILGRLDLATIPFDAEQALECGLLRVSSKRFGLSLGDRACIGLAIRRDATAFTTGREWSQLKLAGRIRVLR